jgi:hypothetical protein
MVVVVAVAVGNNKRYMLADYNLARLISQLQYAKRETVLKSSRNLFSSFLALCDSYGLLSKSDRAALDPSTSHGRPAAGPSNVDPAARRNEKIAKYLAGKNCRP